MSHETKLWRDDETRHDWHATYYDDPQPGSAGYVLVQLSYEEYPHMMDVLRYRVTEAITDDFTLLTLTMSALEGMLERRRRPVDWRAVMDAGRLLGKLP